MVLDKVSIDVLIQAFKIKRIATAHKVKVHQCSFTSGVNEPFEPHNSSLFQVTLGSWLKEVMVFLPGLSAPSPLTMLVSLEGLGWIEKGYIGGSSAVQEHKVAEEQWWQWAAVCSEGAENVIRRGKKSIGLN